jgi:hypothetical protein
MNGTVSSARQRLCVLAPHASSSSLIVLFREKQAEGLWLPPGQRRVALQIAATCTLLLQPASRGVGNTECPCRELLQHRGTRSHTTKACLPQPATGNCLLPPPLEGLSLMAEPSSPSYHPRAPAEKQTTRDSKRSRSPCNSWGAMALAAAPGCSTQLGAEPTVDQHL